jgi:hypothetical protein
MRFPPRTATLFAAAAALMGFEVTLLVAPHLLELGFPLDDAWIHSVYAREIAHSFTYAYNPGIPATGATSQLWPLILAPLQWLAPTDLAYTAFAKMLGFVLHFVASVWLADTLARRPAPSNQRGRCVMEGAAAGALVALHPDLVAASLSGMEIALAEVVVVFTLRSALFGGRRVMLVLAGLLAFLSRPELALVAVLLPVFLAAQRGCREALRAGIPSAGGAMLGVAAMALRNLSVSGMPLPATFYAKVGGSGSSTWSSLYNGFVELCDRIVVVDSGIGLVAVFALSVYSLGSLLRHNRPEPDVGAACGLTGLFFMAVSFVLIPPIDPNAFYHQRYILPGVMILVAGLPSLAIGTIALAELDSRQKSRVLGVAGFVLLASFAIDYPARIGHLESDCTNIDDVQVRVGKLMRGLGPDTVLWTADAGAPRYFSRGFVVDMIGLNTPELLGAERTRYLGEHPPTHIVVLPTVVDLVEASATPDAERFSTSTPYTVTSFQPMSTQYLLRCAPGIRGVLEIRMPSLAAIPTPFACRAQ